MKTEIIKISKLKNNTGQVKGLPKNPRILKDDGFIKLKKSLQDDPEMLELREVIAYDNNGELVVICGNMRLNALKELGIKEVPTKILPFETSVEKLKAYTIKDNVPFGEHSWEDLANEWEVEDLDNWGLDTWKINTSFTSLSEAEDIVTNNEKYKDTDGYAMDYLNSDIKKFEIYVDKIDYEAVINKLNSIKETKGYKNNSEAVVALILNS